MPTMSNPLLALLEELRAIAQLGLHYDTGDAYDQARYRRLLELASGTYGELFQVEPDVVLKRFQSELGHITPKVGVDAAIFDADNRLLLVKRLDDGCWGLPAGWCDVNESPRQAIARELREELSLEIEARGVIDVFTRLPGEYDSPHTTYHLLFEARLISGTPRCQPEEVTDWGWFGPEAELEWHRDHQRSARRAWEAQHV